MKILRIFFPCFYTSLFLCTATSCREDLAFHKPSPPSVPLGKHPAHIAYVSVKDGNTGIYRMKPDGTEKTRIASIPGEVYDMTWSPDGRRAAYEEDSNIFLLALDDEAANEPAPIQLTDTGECGDPA